MVLAKEKLDVAAVRVSYVEKAVEGGAERDLALKEARVELLESELQAKAVNDRIRFLKDVHLRQKKAELQLEISRRKLELIHAKNQLSRAAQQSRITVEAARERYEMERTRLQRFQNALRRCCCGRERFFVFRGPWRPLSPSVRTLPAGSKRARK